MATIKEIKSEFILVGHEFAAVLYLMNNAELVFVFGSLNPPAHFVDFLDIFSSKFSGPEISNKGLLTF